jgi:VanZ family protein
MLAAVATAKTSGRTQRRSPAQKKSTPSTSAKSRTGGSGKGGGKGGGKGKSGGRRKGKGKSKGRGSRPFTGLLIRGLWILLGLAGVVVFAAVVSHVTLKPDPGAGKYVHDNTHPGETLRLYLDQPSVRAALLEIGGNVLLLMPLGVLLPVLSERFRGALRIFFVVGFVSFCIETVQGTMVAGRAFDTDDVILNTVGAVLAYVLVGRRVARWAHHSARHAR